MVREIDIMSDNNGDNIWEKVVSLCLMTPLYKFSADNWSIQESLILMIHVLMEIIILLIEF